MSKPSGRKKKSVADSRTILSTTLLSKPAGLDALEEELQSKLDLARIASGTYTSEGTGRAGATARDVLSRNKGRINRRPLSVIEGVEEFRTELKPRVLSAPQTLDVRQGEVLEKRKIKAVDPRAANDVTACVSEGARRLQLECRRVEELIWGAVPRAEVWIRNDVRTLADVRPVAKTNDVLIETDILRQT
jgi:hypothetical protein